MSRVFGGLTTIILSGALAASLSAATGGGMSEGASASPPPPPKPVEKPIDKDEEKEKPAPGLALGVTMPDYKPAPPIWKLADLDTEIYFFGTIHSLPLHLRWRNKTLEKILDSVDEVAFESRTDNHLQSEEVLDKVMHKVFHYNRPPLLERVEPKYRTMLKDEVKLARQKMYFVDGMPSWHTAMNLMPAAPYGPGSYSAFGVENVLEPEMRRRGKKVVALEDGPEVFLKLSAVPEAAQNSMLNRAMARNAEYIELRKTLKPNVQNVWDRHVKWASGTLNVDDDGIDRQMFGPEFFKALVTDRNANWVDWIVERMNKPGKIFIAVGYAHLVGPDSVQNMLARRGLKPKRIQ